MSQPVTVSYFSHSISEQHQKKKQKSGGIVYIKAGAGALEPHQNFYPEPKHYTVSQHCKNIKEFLRNKVQYSCDEHYILKKSTP
jgi:hypothetical protein